MANPSLFRLIDKAVYDYHMIEDGDRILVGASGGKDSTALLQYFAWRKKQHRDNFEIEAVHVSTDIAPPLDPGLQQLFTTWGISCRTINVNVLERLQPGHTMNCWWCSTQRRTELNNIAIAEGFNKIALGHHLDDILETLLMNMMQKGELSTMPPRLTYNKYPVTVIRPLCYAPVADIIRHAQKEQFLMQTCTCSYQENSARKTARSRLESLTGGDNTVKRRMLESLKNVRPGYLA